MTTAKRKARSTPRAALKEKRTVFSPVAKGEAAKEAASKPSLTALTRISASSPTGRSDRWPESRSQTSTKVEERYLKRRWTTSASSRSTTTSWETACTTAATTALASHQRPPTGKVKTPIPKISFTNHTKQLQIEEQRNMLSNTS